MNVSKDKTNSNVRRVKGMERILDATCGSKMMWFDKQHPLRGYRIYLRKTLVKRVCGSIRKNTEKKYAYGEGVQVRYMT
jgi:hypothetical protein